jgi:hypothetical protein
MVGSPFNDLKGLAKRISGVKNDVKFDIFTAVYGGGQRRKVQEEGRRAERGKRK